MPRIPTTPHPPNLHTSHQYGVSGFRGAATHDHAVRRILAAWSPQAPHSPRFAPAALSHISVRRNRPHCRQRWRASGRWVAHHDWRSNYSDRSIASTQHALRAPRKHRHAGKGVRCCSINNFDYIADLRFGCVLAAAWGDGCFQCAYASNLLLWNRRCGDGGLVVRPGASRIHQIYGFRRL